MLELGFIPQKIPRQRQSQLFITSQSFCDANQHPWIDQLIYLEHFLLYIYMHMYVYVFMCGLNGGLNWHMHFVLLLSRCGMFCWWSMVIKINKIKKTSPGTVLHRPVEWDLNPNNMRCFPEFPAGENFKNKCICVYVWMDVRMFLLLGYKKHDQTKQQKKAAKEKQS